MTKRPLWDLSRQRLEYESASRYGTDPVKIPLPATLILYAECAYQEIQPLTVKPGDTISAGQFLLAPDETILALVAPAAGKVLAVEGNVGEFGRSCTTFRIATDVDGPRDGAFARLAAKPSLEVLQKHLSGLPGAPPFYLFGDAAPYKIDTLVVSGVDSDLLVVTNQFVMSNRMADIRRGVEILRQVTGVDQIVGVVPRDRVQGFGHLGMELLAVDTRHPAALPAKIMHDVFGKTVPAGRECQDVGTAFFKAEAVAAIGRAFDSGRPPAAKLLTLIDKQGQGCLVEAVPGTSLKVIFKALDIEIHDRDRIVIGGPMTGSAIHSEDFPIQADTDAVMVQDGADVPLYSNYPCINCGECVRICPARIAVNMLVRFLEAAQYETAAAEYDLYACIGCGLCSYVCVARIPIFQYIRLAKHELEHMQSLEAAHG